MTQWCDWSELLRAPNRSAAEEQFFHTQAAPLSMLLHDICILFVFWMVSFFNHVSERIQFELHYSILAHSWLNKKLKKYNV